MSEFVCKKPITLSGRSFTYGELIPDGYVLPERALALLRSNYIAAIEPGALAAEAITPILPFQSDNGENLITIPIMAKEGILEATMSSQSVITVLTILQENTEEATKKISEMEEMDALILVHAVDSRKGIQKAAEERAAQLKKNLETEDSEKGDA